VNTVRATVHNFSGGEFQVHYLFCSEPTMAGIPASMYSTRLLIHSPWLRPGLLFLAA
jgi:hypothetical protein